MTSENAMTVENTTNERQGAPSETADGQAGLLQRVMKRVARALRERAGAPKQLRLLETLSCGGRRQVQLIEVEGCRYLAGGSADCIHVLLPLGGDRP